MIPLVSIDDIRAIATPQSVAKHFLGEPSYSRGKNNWYCSPFRSEEHPSFKVDDVGMYDFGSNESYDIFKFVQKLNRCSFKESTGILASIYGVTERTYESKSLVEWYKAKREEEQREREELDWFYLRVWDEVDDEQKLNNELLKIFAGDFSDDTYKICIDEQVSIIGMVEWLVDMGTYDEKKELLERARRKGLPKWLQPRIEKYISSLERYKVETSRRPEF